MHKILNPEAIYMLGDIHGNLQCIREFIIEFGIKNSLIIQVGDLGVGFRDYLNDEADWYSLELLNNFLVKNNNFLIAIRGNHDNPKFWKDGKEPQFSNLWLISDYETVKINNELFLFIGGAISIDRNVRTKGKDYWPDEIFFLDLNRIKDLDHVDVVVTHTAPDIAEPPLMSLLPGPHLTQNFRDVVNEGNAERTLVTQLALNLPNQPRRWYYGHFHKHYITQGSIGFIGLATEEFFEHRV